MNTLKTETKRATARDCVRRFVGWLSVPLWIIIAIVVGLGMWLIAPAGIMKELAKELEQKKFDAMVLYYGTIAMVVIGCIQLWDWYF